MSEQNVSSRLPSQPRWNWIGAAVCGAFAMLPLVVEISVLSALLSALLWVTYWRAWS